LGGGTVFRARTAVYVLLDRTPDAGGTTEETTMSAIEISETEARFRADPAAARSKPAVTATLVNGRARLSAGSFNWDADLPAALGGENLAPSPTAYMLGALAGCAVVFLRDTLARQFDVRLDDVTAVAGCSSDLRGLLAIDDVAPDLGDFTLSITISSPSPAERIEAMFSAWQDRCPIYLALLKPNAIRLETGMATVA
jgi:uncharacterized OsmC-like protein